MNNPDEVYLHYYHDPTKKWLTRPINDLELAILSFAEIPQMAEGFCHGVIFKIKFKKSAWDRRIEQMQAQARKKTRQ